MRTLPFFLILAACGPKVEPEAPVDPVQVLQAETPAEGEATSPESAWGEVPAEPVVTAPPPPTEEELLAKAESDLQQAAGLLTTRRESDTRRAIELLLEVTSNYSDNALAYYNLGVAYQSLDENADARKAYLRSTDIYPGMGDAWLNLGAMRRNQGDNARAMQYYRAGLRDDPENMRLRSALVSVLRAQGKYELAVEQAKKGLEINANSLEIYNELAMIYLAEAEAGIDVPTKLALSQFYLQRAEKREGENHPRVQCNRGRVYELKGLVFQATESYQKALGLDPNLVQCAIYLSAIYLDSRNYDDAIPLLERAAQIEPENAAIRLNLGIAYRGARATMSPRRSTKKYSNLSLKTLNRTSILRS